MIRVDRSARDDDDQTTPDGELDRCACVRSEKGEQRDGRRNYDSSV